MTTTYPTARAMIRRVREQAETAGNRRPLVKSQVVRFTLGQVCATPGALSSLFEILFSGRPNSVQAMTERANTTAAIVPLIQRHASGDWGDVGAEDWAANEEALRSGGRLFSVYQLGAEVRLWVITEADRSATTILLPEEY